MVKLKKNKAGHPNFLHLNDVLHHMGDGVVHAHDWLAGPATTAKERSEHKLAETESIRRMEPFSF